MELYKILNENKRRQKRMEDKNKSQMLYKVWRIELVKICNIKIINFPRIDIKAEAIEKTKIDFNAKLIFYVF